MQTPPHGHGHHTPSSSASHDAYTHMVSKHCGSFVRLGEKPLHRKRHFGIHSRFSGIHPKFSLYSVRFTLDSVYIQ